MALPSISEILGQPTSAAQSTTPMGTAFDISQGAQQVFQAAQIQQQADWQRYGQFTKNLQDAIGDVNKISELEVAPEDRPAIMEKTAEVLKKMKDNLGAMANPMADPAAYAALKKEGADAYSLAIKSKQRHAYDIATKSFMQNNPEFFTPENKKILQSSFSTPLDAWQPYQLGNPMPAFDINKLATDANTFAENPDFMEVVGNVGGKDPKTGQYTKGNEFVLTRKGTVYDEGKFTDKWDSYYNYADKNGINTIRDWTKTFVYDQLDDKEKKRLDATGDPLKAAWMEYGKNLRAKDKLGETMEESDVWKTKYEEGQANYRSKVAASSRGGGGTPTTAEQGSIYDYTITKTPALANGGVISFSDLPSYTQDFLQSTFEKEETVGQGFAATKIKVRIPDNAKVSVENGNLTVRDGAGKVLRNYDKSGMDAEYGERTAKKLSGKQDYESTKPVTGGTSSGKPPTASDPLGIR